MDDQTLMKNAINEGRNYFSAGAFVIYNNKILIIRRKKNDSRPGNYEIPSGGVERGELPSEGAIRELKEETNLDGEIVCFKNYFDFTASRGEVRQFNFIVEVKDITNIILTEHDDFKWATKEDLNNIQMSSECKIAIFDVL